MRMVDVIQKKREDVELTDEEIQFFIQGYTTGDIPDYQAAAFAMAIVFKGMTQNESAALTKAMVESGDQTDLSDIAGIKVDKHSTGGVGDTTTLVLAPLVASLGIPVAKMSGRGLGHTGGTLDKLEAVPGFQIEITDEKFIELVNQHKVAVIGQTANLTPADKKLYALRDVTATVDSIPLIASSIMSKKIASGSDAIVLDVKVGNGAFMKDLNQAEALAKTMVDIGNNVGRNTKAVISNMNQPLGFAVGNALEIKEAIETLQGEGPEDLYELSLALGSHMVLLAEKANTLEEARQLLEENINNGKAIETLKTFFENQGGNAAVVDDLSLLPTAAYQFEVKSQKSGYVSEIIADQIGLAAMHLGAGRLTKDSEIDLAVGIILNKKIGDKVEAGEPLAIVHSNSEDVSESVSQIHEAYQLVDNHVKEPTLIYKEIH